MPSRKDAIESIYILHTSLYFALACLCIVSARIAGNFVACCQNMQHVYIFQYRLRHEMVTMIFNVILHASCLLARWYRWFYSVGDWVSAISSSILPSEVQRSVFVSSPTHVLGSEWKCWASWSSGRRDWGGAMQRHHFLPRTTSTWSGCTGCCCWTPSSTWWSPGGGLCVVSQFRVHFFKTDVCVWWLFPLLHCISTTNEALEDIQ